MGFSQDDLAELRGRLNSGRVRFGPRFVPRKRLNVPYQGVRPELLEKGHHPPPKGRSKPPEEPSYDVKYQRRLW